jgi:fatty acid omega-hydroxylase
MINLSLCLQKLAEQKFQLISKTFFMHFSFDNICKLGFGVDVACLDFSLPNVTIAQAFDMATSISSTQAFNFPFILRLQCVLHVGNERKMCQALCDIDDFAMFVIHMRRTINGN